MSSKSPRSLTASRHLAPALAVLAFTLIAVVVASRLARRWYAYLFQPQPAGFHIEATPDWFEVTPETAVATIPSLQETIVHPSEPSVISTPCRLLFAFDSIVLSDTGRPSAKLDGDTLHWDLRDFHGMRILPTADTHATTGVALVRPSPAPADGPYYVWRSGKLVSPAVYRDLDSNRVEVAPREITFSPTGRAAVVVRLVEDTLADNSAILLPFSFGTTPSSMGAVVRALQARRRRAEYRSLALYTRTLGANEADGFSVRLTSDSLTMEVRDARIRFVSEGYPLAGSFHLGIGRLAAPVMCYTVPRRRADAQFVTPGLSLTLDSISGAHGRVDMSGGTRRCVLAGTVGEATVNGRVVEFSEGDQIEVRGIVEYAFCFEAYSPPSLTLRGTATSFSRSGRQILTSRWEDTDSGVKGGVVGFAASLLTLLIGSWARRRP